MDGVTLSLSKYDDIRVYDILGIEHTNLTPTLSEGEGVRIDISGLVPGVYFVRVGDMVRKFLKI